ncbi:MAG: 2'-5' RNA ligase family protein [Novosphingobium meiothermophilum]|uniref:2'-5' RNA ligase family protein n=1 Tax=Novosphingobium TaxID=165696 RepID=UPI001F3A006F|nr:MULTISPECIES: 2'-5' RNA ligase family protein [Novosphingobium]
MQRWADALRVAHYPPERNRVQAHVTLFHALRPTMRDEVCAMLAGMGGSYAPVAAYLDGIMDLGTGTALAITSPGMMALRARMAEHLHGMLTAQDMAEPRLHITVQNKVSRNAARALQKYLSGWLEPRRFVFTGLAVHRYRGSSWENAGQWSFRGCEKA